MILVPEGRRLFGGLSVLDNLELGAYARRAQKSQFKTLRRVFEVFPYWLNGRISVPIH